MSAQSDLNRKLAANVAGQRHCNDGGAASPDFFQGEGWPLLKAGLERQGVLGDVEAAFGQQCFLSLNAALHRESVLRFALQACRATSLTEKLENEALQALGLVVHHTLPSDAPLFHAVQDALGLLPHNERRLLLDGVCLAARPGGHLTLLSLTYLSTEELRPFTERLGQCGFWTDIIAAPPFAPARRILLISLMGQVP